MGFVNKVWTELQIKFGQNTFRFENKVWSMQ